MPVEARDLFGRLSVLVIALHHQRSADDDFAALACRQKLALLVHHAHLGQGRRSSRRSKTPMGDRSIGVEVILRRHGRDHHRRLGLTEQLRHDWPDLVDRLLQLRSGNRRGSVPEALQRASIGPGEFWILQEHVDQGRRQERMGDAAPLDEAEKLGEIRLGHDDDPAAQGQYRETQDAGRMSQWRERKIDGAAIERIAHQRQGGHRLQIAPREHHAFGLTGGSAGPRNHRNIVCRRDLDRFIVDAVEPRIERRREGRRLVEADKKRKLGQVGAHLLHERRVSAVEDQARAVEGVEDEAVLGRLIARVDRTPDGAGARDAEDAGECDRVIARQDRHLVARLDAGTSKRPGDAPGEALHVAVGHVSFAHGQAGRGGPERSALVQIVDQPHGALRASSFGAAEVPPHGRTRN